MKVIEKIEIKNFRSFDNRKQNKTQITKIEDLNIFSGANDSGKSNILRALNLFFNKRTNINDFLDFSHDFFKKDSSSEHDIKQEMITVKISFWNEKNRHKNRDNDFVRLPEKFWVSRKWLKNSEFSSYKQDDGVEISFRKEKGKERWQNYYEKVDGKLRLKQHAKASLSLQLSSFLESIQYHYVPAIKDRRYFSHLYGELQETLLKELNSDVNNKKSNFEVAIQSSTEDLMNEFRSVVNNVNINMSAVFELPDLINLFRTLNVQTGDVNLLYRGDGIQAKLIPEILNFIAIKELKIKPSKIIKGKKVKKYFIWGFEEPENSYEYKNAQLLANRIKDTFSKNAQIFISTHSFNFISLEGQNISTYRVWKDNATNSSRISKIKKEENGRFIFEGSELQNDADRLNEELGIFNLNEELEKIFIELERKKEEFSSRINAIRKPIIYTEGNNVKYIKKAKEFFAPALDIEIESLGGKSDIKKFFQRFSDAKFSRFKIIFIFDCDAISEFNYCEELKTEFLIPYIFTKNESNTQKEIQVGVENLFNDYLFEGKKKIFSITEVKEDGILINRKRSLKKNEFCKYICEERNNESDFKNFEKLFDIINSILLL